jgi:hypothetical protein
MELDPVVVHRIFGALIAAFAIVIVLHEIDVVRGGWAAYLPAAALLAGGGLLFLDPWLVHGGDFGAEGNQHAWQGLAAVAAGVLEFYRVHRRSGVLPLQLVIPAVLAGLGAGFLWHEQHETGDMLLQTAQHRVMGATLLLAAAVRLAASLRWREGQWSRAGWALVVLGFSLQLLLYVEVSAHGTH